MKLAKFLVRTEQIRGIRLILAGHLQDVGVILFQIVALLESVHGDRLQPSVLGQAAFRENLFSLPQTIHHQLVSYSRVDPRHETQQLAVVGFGRELHLRNVVQEEVELREPRLERYVNHLRERCRRLRIRLARKQRIADVVHRFDRYAGDARGRHQGKHVQYQVTVLAHDVERGAAQIDELVELGRRPIASVYHVRHVRGQDERGAISETG